MHSKRTALAVMATVALAGIGSGSALAATGTKATAKSTKTIKSTTLTSDSTAIITALAAKLGISLDTLKTAIVGTAKDRVAGALAAGTITQAQADTLNARITANGGTLGDLGGFGFGHGPGVLGGLGGLGGPHGVVLSVAATYLGLTVEALDTSLDAGKTLAAIATAQGKTADGLVAALVADAKTKIDALTGLTDAQKAARLTLVTTQIKDVVENGLPMKEFRGGGRHGHGFRGR